MSLLTTFQWCMIISAVKLSIPGALPFGMLLMVSHISSLDGKVCNLALSSSLSTFSNVRFKFGIGVCRGVAECRLEKYLLLWPSSQLTNWSASHCSPEYSWWSSSLGELWLPERKNLYPGHPSWSSWCAPSAGYPLALYTAIQSTWLSIHWSCIGTLYYGDPIAARRLRFAVVMLFLLLI